MGKKILVIEDSPTTIGVIKAVLSKDGYEVSAVESGEEGIKKINEEKFDLIISDTVLGGIDGFELCRRARNTENSKDSKIIVMTGSIDAVDAVRARKSGADDYCVKTKDFTHLKEIIKRIFTDSDVQRD
ncbi:MAG: response regulator [Candidatus Omnitrophota bacterium]